MVMPTQVDDHVSIFDRFAAGASTFVSRPLFFVGCVLTVLIWAPSILIFKDIDTWQLIINTTTTIITFLMLAVLQNSQARAQKAVDHKLNAIAAGLACLLELEGLTEDVTELKAAIGLEKRESS